MKIFTMQKYGEENELSCQFLRRDVQKLRKINNKIVFGNYSGTIKPHSFSYYRIFLLRFSSSGMYILSRPTVSLFSDKVQRLKS